MKNKTLTYLALSLLCCICACTSVDLCPEAEHPHITDMRVRMVADILLAIPILLIWIQL